MCVYECVCINVQQVQIRFHAAFVFVVVHVVVLPPLTYYANANIFVYSPFSLAFGRETERERRLFLGLSPLGGEGFGVLRGSPLNRVFIYLHLLLLVFYANTTTGRAQNRFLHALTLP